jgi:hypothetical protein
VRNRSGKGRRVEKRGVPVRVIMFMGHVYLKKMSTKKKERKKQNKTKQS